MECSSGTYVRQLVADLGELCGAGAHCTALERTRVGPFDLADADPERLVSLSDALAFLPERPLSPERPPRCATDGRSPATPPGPVRLTLDGELVAVARGADGLLRPETVVA